MLKRASFALARVVGVEHDVVAVAAGRPEAVDAARAVSSCSSTMRASSLLARLRRARAPPRRTAGARGSAGSCPLQLPRGEEEGPVDVARPARASGTSSSARRPMNAGCATSSARQSMRGRVRAAPRRAAGAACRACSRAARAARACSSRFLRVELAALLADRAAPPPRRRRATRRARAPSARANSGAIFTAVCCRLVVAPPMSSGSVEARAAPSPWPRAPSRRATA